MSVKVDVDAERGALGESTLCTPFILAAPLNALP